MLLGGCLAGATRLASLNGFEGLQDLRAGGATELKLSRSGGMPVGLAAAGLLGRSAATLTSVDFRSAACVCVRACACACACACVRACMRGRGCVLDVSEATCDGARRPASPQIFWGTP